MGDLANDGNDLDAIKRAVIDPQFLRNAGRRTIRERGRNDGFAFDVALVETSAIRRQTLGNGLFEILLNPIDHALAVKHEIVRQGFLHVVGLGLIVIRFEIIFRLTANILATAVEFRHEFIDDCVVQVRDDGRTKCRKSLGLFHFDSPEKLR